MLGVDFVIILYREESFLIVWTMWRKEEKVANGNIAD